MFFHLFVPREIIEEEMQVEQMPGRSRFSGHITRDPEAPPKPERVQRPIESPVMGMRSSMVAMGGGVGGGGALPMTRVGSDTGIAGNRVSGMLRPMEPHPHPHPQQIPPHMENMENWRDVSPEAI